MTFTYLNCLTLLIALFVIPLNAQKQTLRIRANIMVLNGQNKLVDDLRKEDIKVFEDGVEQKIESFIKKESVNLGIVLDKSGSLRFQLGLMRNIAGLFVDNLRATDEAFIIGFASSDKIEIIQNWTSDKNLLKKGIGSVLVAKAGRSAVLDAIYLTARKLREKESRVRRSAIVLISDCEERASYYNEKQLLKSMAGDKTEIYIIGLIRDLAKSGNFIRKSPRNEAIKLGNRLARQTLGMAFFPKYTNDNQKELVKAARSVILELRSQYVVEYVSTNQKRKKSPRKLKIEVASDSANQKRFGFTRDEYVVPKN